MASTVDMDVARAKTWQEGISRLNQELAQVLQAINESVQSIATGAEGSLLSRLWNNVKEMFSAAGNLVKAFVNLVDSVGSLIAKATNLADKILDGISTIGKFVGFLGI